MVTGYNFGLLNKLNLIRLQAWLVHRDKPSVIKLRKALKRRDYRSKAVRWMISNRLETIRTENKCKVRAKKIGWRLDIGYQDNADWKTGSPQRYNLFKPNGVRERAGTIKYVKELLDMANAPV